jgi:hypothetical protein
VRAIRAVSAREAILARRSTAGRGRIVRGRAAPTNHSRLACLPACPSRRSEPGSNSHARRWPTHASAVFRRAARRRPGRGRGVSATSRHRLIDLGGCPHRRGHGLTAAQPRGSTALPVHRNQHARAGMIMTNRERAFPPPSRPAMPGRADTDNRRTPTGLGTKGSNSVSEGDMVLPHTPAHLSLSPSRRLIAAQGERGLNDTGLYQLRNLRREPVSTPSARRDPGLPAADGTPEPALESGVIVLPVRECFPRLGRAGSSGPAGDRSVRGEIVIEP